MEAHVWNLRTARSFQIITYALAASANHLECRIIDYSVQRNHIHLIGEASDYPHRARAIRGFAIRIARGLNKLMGTKGKVFAERYHMHVLQTPREVRHARAYVLQNARKHAAQGGVRYPAHWLDPYSSGRYFDGWKVRIKSQTFAPIHATGPPVAKATTQLLRQGWRRWGLIDPAEVPGH
jgi:hypothetical protein